MTLCQASGNFFLLFFPVCEGARKVCSRNGSRIGAYGSDVIAGGIGNDRLHGRGGAGSVIANKAV